MTDHCIASVKALRERIIFSYVLKAQNEHEWKSESILFQPQNTPLFTEVHRS